jgi:hypothetical protein
MSLPIETQSSRQKEPPLRLFFRALIQFTRTDDGLLGRSCPLDHLKLEIAEANFRGTARM